MKYKLEIERGGRDGEEKKENVRTWMGRKVFQEKKGFVHSVECC